jgi:hypothetical protein
LREALGGVREVPAVRLPVAFAGDAPTVRPMTTASAWLWEARPLLNGGGLPGGEGAVIEPANRAALRDIVTAHALPVVSETRYRLHVREQGPGDALIRPYVVTASRADAHELHLAIAHTMLRWDRGRRALNASICPEALIRRPDDTWTQIAQDPTDRGLRSLSYELAHKSASRAGNGQFGTAFTSADPTVQLLGQLLTDRIGDTPVRVDLETGRPRAPLDALVHADLIDIVLAEHALARRDISRTVNRAGPQGAGGHGR